MMVGCRKTESVEEEFMANLTESQSYKVEGMMETFYDNDRKQNDFVVFYKVPDLIKVTIKSVENEDQQIILKNKNGVYVLIPSVNKNFKIQSTWPTNASYPYLLQSLAKDIANDKNLVRVEGDATVEVETDTFMHTDANVVKQKIIFDKSTALPTEVKVYDTEGDLYIRCVFKNIELDYNVNDTEFNVNETVTSARLTYGEEGLVFTDRVLSVPPYFPVGSSLNSKVVSDERAIMKFTGNYGFTIIQQFINDSNRLSSEEEDGVVVMVLGNVGILTDKYLKFIYEGVVYTFASENIKLEELMKMASSYMIPAIK
jgi:outer membrane lipoprotein-sorting protein